MKKNTRLLIVALLGIFIFSCSSDDDSVSSANQNVWVVYLQGSGDGGVDIQYGGETFCYESGECNSISGLSFVGTFGDSRLDIASSNTDEVAKGVLIENIEVTSGSGIIEVVSASVREVDGFTEFEEGATLFTSPELSSGDNYTLEFGELN